MHALELTHLVSSKVNFTLASVQQENSKQRREKIYRDSGHLIRALKWENAFILVHSIKIILDDFYQFFISSYYKRSFVYMLTSSKFNKVRIFLRTKTIWYSLCSQLQLGYKVNAQ